MEEDCSCASNDASAESDCQVSCGLKRIGNEGAVEQLHDDDVRMTWRDDDGRRVSGRLSDYILSMGAQTHGFQYYSPTSFTPERNQTVKSNIQGT